MPLYRVPTLLLTKNAKTFPGLSRNPKTFFQDSVVARQCLNIQTAVWPDFTCDSTIQHRTFSTSCRNYSVSNDAGILRTFIYTHGILHIQRTLAIFNHKQIPELSRTSNSNFPNFPGPNSFSVTLQVLEIFRKNPGLSTMQRNHYYRITKEKARHNKLRTSLMLLNVALTHATHLFDAVVHTFYKTAKPLQALLAKQHQQTAHSLLPQIGKLISSVCDISWKWQSINQSIQYNIICDKKWRVWILFFASCMNCIFNELR